MIIITSLVKKGSRERLEEIFKENNADYLVKGENNPDFPYLSEVENYDYSAFSSKHMDGIIEELSRVKQEVNELSDKEHIDDIIRLAERCKNTPDTVLVFAS